MNNITTQEGIYSLYMSLLSKEQQKLIDETLIMYGSYSGTGFNTNEMIFSKIVHSEQHLLGNKTTLNQNVSDVDSSQGKSSNCSTKEEQKQIASKKVFTCTFDQCAKSFNYKWILDRHINSHFCFKLFKCEVDDCEKAYKSKENLNLHVRNKHLNEKPYQCSYCDSKFSHRNGILNINSR